MVQLSKLTNIETCVVVASLIIQKVEGMVKAGSGSMFIIKIESRRKKVIVVYNGLMMTIWKEKQIVVIPVQNHVQHEHSTAPNKAEYTKCLKTLIRHHGVDV
jgi:hypothetical protein